MKKRIFIFTVLAMLFALNVNASWYVIDKDTNRGVGIMSYQPDQADLDSRGEIAIESDEEISVLDAELHQGKIQVRAKSQEEKNIIKEREDKAEKKKVDSATAKVKLIDLGFTEDEADIILK